MKIPSDSHENVSTCDDKIIITDKPFISVFQPIKILKTFETGYVT